MNRTFLAKLHTNGIYYIIGALLLLPGVPLYQLLVLAPQGYSDAFTSASSGHFGPYLAWIHSHVGQFIGSRLLLILAFGLVFSLPFTLFRIIIAQEVLGYEEDEEEVMEEDVQEQPGEEDKEESEDVFAEAWRGKSYA